MEARPMPQITLAMTTDWGLNSDASLELFAGREALTPHAICDAGLPVSVRLYVLLRPEIIPTLELLELAREFVVRALRHHYIEQLADIVGLLGGYCSTQRHIASLDAQLAAGELTPRVHAHQRLNMTKQIALTFEVDREGHLTLVNKPPAVPAQETS